MSRNNWNSEKRSVERILLTQSINPVPVQAILLVHDQHWLGGRDQVPPGGPQQVLGPDQTGGRPPGTTKI